MDKKRYDELFLGCFVTSDRDMQLYNEIEKYYKETENLSSFDSITKAKQLSEWCRNNGVSHKEKIYAKRIIEQQLF
jgi:hypothetical protein